MITRTQARFAPTVVTIIGFDTDNLLIPNIWIEHKGLNISNLHDDHPAGNAAHAAS
jgi:hypothetical protein